MAMAPRDTRSFGELLGDLIHETQTLFRKEIELVKTEVSAKVERASGGIGIALAGALLLNAAAVIFLQGFAVILAGWLGMGVGSSGLLVGLIVALAAVLVIRRGAKRTRGANLMPEGTIRQIKKDAELIKEQVS